MKTIRLALLLGTILGICSASKAQEILFPPTNTVLYVGDQVTVAWKTHNRGNDVWIHLFDTAWPGGTTIFIAMQYPDSGEFQWTVGKGSLTQTNLELTVFYGSAPGQASYIPLAVLPGPRPPGIPVPTIQPVGITNTVARKVISIEWPANTNHIYQVKAVPYLSSTNWIVVAEGKPEGTNAFVLFYEDASAQFFKVEDTTPFRP